VSPPGGCLAGHDSVGKGSIASPYATVSSAYVADCPAAVVPIIGGIIRPTVVVEIRRAALCGYSIVQVSLGKSFDGLG
jgi:hypothetical protein